MLNSNLCFKIGDGTNNYACTSGVNYLDNSWHHVALTAKSNDRAILYFDGNPVLIRQIGQLVTNDVGLVLAVQSIYWKGFLDEVRISNTVRYTSNFTPQTTPFETDEYTKLLLHFDENGDDPRNTGKAIDSSGNNNHGTITGAKYVSGLVGVDASSTDTGAVYSSSNQGIFIEEGTTNLITNPSFENATSATLNWGSNYFTYATAAATFTPNMAKRNSAGPFAAGVMAQGDTATWHIDSIRSATTTQIAGNFYNLMDLNQGSIVLWLTPEWNGNDGLDHTLFQSANYWYLTKNSANKLEFSTWGGAISVDASNLLAGNTYNIVIRWDLKNSLDGFNNRSISINDVHSYVNTGHNIATPSVLTIGHRFSGFAENPSGPANAIIEGLTIYRRPLFDGTYGIDVGNGDEIAQIYNSGTGKDPTLITGSWDVVFALPTNASTGTLTTGTGNAWSHPHSSNLLYTSTTNTGGFMMNGTASTDGWNEIPWYKVGGASGVVAAYQPIGAASYTASKTNLANPGTYNATEGVAPTWSATDGWTFNGSSQYLGSGVYIDSTTYSSIVRFVADTSVVNGNALLGTVYGTKCFLILESWNGGSTGLFQYSDGVSLQYSPRLSSGVVAISGGLSYRNGSVASGSMTPVAVPNYSVDIGRRNGATPVYYYKGNIQAAAIYSSTLTSDQVANVTDAMEALSSSGTYLTTSALSSTEKIFSGGYKYTSTGANQGIYRSFTATSGGDYVLRALGHSDGTCNPQVKITRADGTTEISHLNGTTTSTRTAPDVYIFTWESPAAEENQVQLLNTATSGTCYWHQVEVYSNMINNPSFEGTYNTVASGVDIAPSWGNIGMSSPGDVASKDTSIYRSGSASQYVYPDSQNQGLSSGNFNATAGKFYVRGLMFYNRTIGSASKYLGIGNVSWWRNQYSGADSGITLSAPLGEWKLNTVITRPTNNTTGSNYFVNGCCGGTSYNIDDVYAFELSDVSLTVTPANQANSTETSGLRVDGADTLTQPITGLSATSGVIKFKYTPRHSAANALKFWEGSGASPRIAYFSDGTANNYIDLRWDSADTLMLAYAMNGTTGSSTYNATSANEFNAGTTYNLEIRYQGGNTMSLLVNGTSRITASSIPSSFSTPPSTAYWGSHSNGLRQADGTISSFVTLTPTSNTTSPYYKFGSKSVKLIAYDREDEYTTSLNPASTATHTLSAYVYDGTTGNVGGTVSTSNAKLVFNGTVVTPASYTDMGGGWWRLTYSAATQNQAGFYGVQALAGKTIYVDGVQLEAKSYATTYADGSLGTGYSWSGTANNSNGVRSSALGTYHTDGIYQGAGTISFWQKITDSWSVAGTWDDYFIAAGPVVLRYNPNCTGCTGQFNAGFNQWWGSASTTNGTIGASYADSGKAYFGSKDFWILTTLSWKQNEFKWYRNTSLVGQDTVFTPPETTTVSNIYTGKNMVTSDLRIYDKALTASEVSSLYYSGLSTHSKGAEGNTRYVSSGTYTSPVMDLGTIGGWGDIPFTGTSTLNNGAVTYYTRTSSDNSSWSSWSEVVGNAISSNAIRYYQWKALLTSATSGSNTPLITEAVTRYVEDTTAPTNPDTVALGYTSLASSSATLISNNFYNYPLPKFTWDAGADSAAPGQSASGLASYRVLLSTSSSAIPSDNTSDDCYLETAPDARTFTVGTTPATCTLTDANYYLRLQTKDNSGNVSDPVTMFVYKYDSTSPAAPSSVSSTTIGYSASNAFTFFWPAASDVGVNKSGIVKYQFKTSATNGIWSDWQDSNAIGATIVTQAADVPAYQQGQNFFFVRSVDLAGNVSASTTNVGVAPFYYNADAPTAPRNIVINPSTTSDNQASSNVFTVTWDKPASYSGEILKYYYCVNCTPSSTTMTETSSAETVDREISNIALATQQGKNTFYLVAEDNNINNETGHGNRNFEAYASADFYAQTVAPGTPQNLLITDASDRDASVWRLTLAWKAPATGGTPTKYEIYRSTDGDSYLLSGNTSSTAYTDADLTKAQVYYYKVRAIDNAGSSSIFSNVVNLAPEGKYTSPPSSGGVPTAAVGSSTATITWTTGRTSYGTVEYGKTSSYGSAGTETTSTVSHSVKLTGLTPGTIYHYRVQSLDDSSLVGYERADAYSADYTFTTLSAPAISKVSTSDIELDSVIVTWTASSLTKATIEYGETTAYGSTIDISVGATEGVHTAKLSSLKHSTIYHFRIKGVDVDGNDVISDDYEFQTILFPKITALVFDTDQSEGGMSAVLGWSTNVPTFGVVEYQSVEIDKEFAKKSSINLSNAKVLQAMTQDELGALVVVPKGTLKKIAQTESTVQHVERISGLSDGSLYVFKVRGKDKYGNEVVSDPIRYVTGADTRAPQLKNIIFETPLVGVGVDTKAQIIVSWETDEPALGQLMWGEGSGTEYPNTTEKEEGYGTRHVIVIRDLSPTTSYHLKILSSDKTGNTSHSEDSVVVTSSAQQAAFDIIIRNLEDVFGFLKL